MDGLRWHSWRLQTAIIGGEARANFDIAPRLDMTNHHVQSQRIYGRVSGTRDRTPPFAAVRTPERTPAGKGEEVRHRALHVIEFVFDPFQSTSPEAAVDDLGVNALVTLCCRKAAAARQCRLQLGVAAAFIDLTRRIGAG